MPFDIGLSW